MIFVLLIEYTNQRLCKQRKIRKSGISARYFRNNKVNKSYIGYNGMPIVGNTFCLRFPIYKERGSKTPDLPPPDRYCISWWMKKVL